MPPPVSNKTVITCGKCGNPNPLGRVFCGTCGGRLELQGMTRDMVASRIEPSQVGAIVLKIVGVIVALLVVLLIIACIPQTTPIGVEGNRSGLSQITSFGRQAEALGRGRTLGRRFSEAELNGYFLGERTKMMKADSCSVDIQEGLIRVRMVRRLGRFTVGSWQFQPTVSCETVFVPVGGRLHLRRARHGLLPLLGPVKYMVGRQVVKSVARLPEAKFASLISEIKAHEDYLDVTVQR